MKFAFILFMVRKTISISEATVSLVEGLRRENESFSAAVARLLETAAHDGSGNPIPGYVGIGDGPAEEFGRYHEKYLAEIEDFD